MGKMGEGASLGAATVRDATHPGRCVLQRLSTHVITCLRVHPIIDMALKGGNDCLFCWVVIKSLHSETAASQAAAASSPHRGIHPRDAILPVQNQRFYGSTIWTAHH